MTRKTYFPETGKVQSSLNPQKTIYFLLFLGENRAEAHTSKSKVGRKHLLIIKK